MVPLRLLYVGMCLLLFSFNTRYVQGFVSSKTLENAGITSGSTTHDEMTENALREMAVIFMTDHAAKYPDHIEAMSTADFKAAIDHFKIGTEFADIIPELKHSAKVHVNAESFTDAMTRLEEERVKVLHAKYMIIVYMI